MSRTLLSAQNLECGFDSTIARLSVELRAGEVTALLGPNGSGKSTVLRTWAGLLSPRAGDLRLGDQPIGALSVSARAARVAYLGSEARAEFPLTAREVVELARISAAKSAPTPDEAIDLCACRDLEHRDFDQLSGGERQRVLLARTVAQGAQLLLLDEALSKMDLHHQAMSGKLLKRLATERGYAVVLVAHDLNLASEWANRAILLDRGQIVADGAVGEVLTPARVSALYPGASLVAGVNPATGAPKIFFS